MVRLWMAGALAGVVAGALAQNTPPQAAKGESLFFNDTVKTPCHKCHALAGRGTAVGPDLRGIARVPPRGFAVAIRSSVTQYVQDVKLKAGDSFAAIKGKEDGDSIELWDLDKNPPELRKLTKAEIDSMKDNSKWKHPPESAEIANEDLAAIIAYIKWAAYKDTKTVDPDDLE